MVLLCLVTIPLAYLTWHFVEAPFRNRQRISRSRIFAVSAATGLSFAAIGVVGAKFPHIVSTGPGFEVSVQKFPHWGCEVDDPVNQFCRLIGDTDKTPSVVLWGDSHAQALAPKLHEELKAKGIAGISITFGGCTPIPNVAIAYEHFDKCIALSDATFRLILGSKKLQSVVLSSRWTAHFEGSPFDNEEGGVEFFADPFRLQTELADGQFGFDKAAISQRFMGMVDQLEDRNLIIVLPIPEAGWDIPRHFSNHLLSGQYDEGPFPAHLGSTSASLYHVRNQATRDLLMAAETTADFVDPFLLFCDVVHGGENRCTTHDQGIPLYFDDDHLSYFGSGRVVAQLMDLLNRPENF